MDWQAFLRARPRLFAGIVFVKRMRTKVGIVLAAYCVAEGLWEHEVPFRLDRPGLAVIGGLMLIAVGLAFRLAAHGVIKKKEALATSGVYSLCRHPLYLGSILLTTGFCVLLDDRENFIVAAGYFAVFYPLTILWEEVRVAERFGEAYRAYRRTTPLLIPLGRFRGGEFRWAHAWRSGGLVLIAMTVLMLSAVEAMARLM